MQYLGIEFDIKNKPVLDPDFIPFGVWMKEYLKEAAHPIKIAVEREDGLISMRESFIRTGDFAEADLRYVERLVKFELWSIGGFRVYICGADDIAEKLAEAYSPTGARQFDYGFVGDVYEKPLEVLAVSEADFPAEHESAKQIGGHMEGCRIGFDAGGSDRKVSAVVDGEAIYSEEVVWYPKVTEDPTYHFDEIVTAFKTAASKMPGVDAIGVSSAGTFVGNSPMVASLFIKVPRERREEVKSIYDRAGLEIGDVPLVVANDGDVTALGCKYFSQDAVIKLAPAANIILDPELSPAEKLKVVQGLANEGDEGALDIYRSIGCYLAHTLVLYSAFYEIKTLLVLGRVASGKGGDLLISECNRILAEEYPELAAQITVTLPDEKMRRVGQSVAAASLPEVR